MRCIDLETILYISFLEVSDKQPQGVSKKIQAQINSLRALDKIVNYTGVLKNDMYLFLENGTKKKLFSLKKSPYINRTILYKLLCNKKIQSQISSSDCVYIRHEGSVITQIPFFIQSKKNQTKILLEIPTYPYDKEWGESLITKIYFWQEKKLSRILGKKIDLISTFSEDEKIFGVQCVNISNGINLNDILLIKKEKKEETVTFSSVSICAPWHGIDRFLYSLEQYLEQNTTEKVKFNIIGEGSQTPKLKKIVRDSQKLSEVVVFHGFKSGQELDEIYNETDIAVGSLARHRSGLTSLKTLKNREYAAKGLPMIYSEIDTDFEQQPFVYKVAPNESTININELIIWYKNLQIEPEEIREYAKQFSWDTQMKKVVDALEEQYIRILK